jgi:predicted glycosyltransferase involved in capsule biosynthesis
MIDVVIIHKNSTIDRENNLKYAISHYRKQLPNSKIIVAEMDSETNIDYFDNLIHLKINSGIHYFCRALALNSGFKEVTSNYILFTDNDCILDEAFFNDINKDVESFKTTMENSIIIPYESSVMDLTENQTKSIFDNTLNFSQLDLNFRQVKSVGGLFLIKSDIYYKLGGYDPRFIGYGAEDNAFFCKAKHFYNILRPNYKVYHLYHSRNYVENNSIYKGNAITDTTSENYENNVKLLREYESFRIDMVINKINEIGYNHLNKI